MLPNGQENLKAMDPKNTQKNQKNKFLKLSLKKNRLENDIKLKKLNRSPDVIILDESFDRFRPEFSKNISFNSSIGEISIIETKDSRPSMGGWSPAQNIIRATPKYDTIPSTPKDVANESSEQCSIKKIQQSQKKLLDDLYGETWKSIPTLFKTIKQNYTNFNGVTKKLQFDDDDESDKENIRLDLKKNRELYLTGSDAKRKGMMTFDSEKKCKKKLYTEKVPSTPVPSVKPVKTRNANSTTKKVKGMSVTELVASMRTDVDDLVKKVEKVTVDVPKKINNVCVTPDNVVKRLTFVGSLADNVPTWRCHPEAFQYRDNYKSTREQLTRRLYKEFNEVVFDNALEEDMPLLWDAKLRSTAGTTTNRLLKNSKGERRRTSSIKLSTKVVDGPQRLRDTLIHELCHAATWLIDGELRAGHGPLWKKWATHALRKYPELGEISRCHDMQIHFKYSYKCTKCGYSIHRHSKSIDVTKKCCGYCRGTFELIINKKNKEGVVVSTPARKGGPNEFAKYVKENYAQAKQGRSHADVMKVLGEQFSAKKKLATTPINLDNL
ncbi:germ cell nuclear acidic protein isoform X2 [Amyelois transitella]|uniref:germ cell nuclear acidic protein isoform X2 n=1 Tax=Amyelois transitella TaxID=680683 RepID=UPI0029900752|nr:germ cell nuclear acidic protein isoform X2 [Amyelois transitella]